MPEKRRQALEESKANRQKELAAVGADETDDALERLIAGLRDGDTITRKAARRRRAGAGETSATNIAIDLNDSGNDASYIARDMLARLQSDGFSVAPPSPTVPTTQRRRRRRTERLDGDKDIPTSPLATEILETEQTASTAEEFPEESGTDISSPTL